MANYNFVTFLLNAEQASIVTSVAIRLCGHRIDSRNEDVSHHSWEYHVGWLRPTSVTLYGHRGQESGLGQALRNLLPAIGCEVTDEEYPASTRV